MDIIVCRSTNCFNPTTSQTSLQPSFLMYIKCDIYYIPLLTAIAVLPLRNIIHSPPAKKYLLSRLNSCFQTRQYGQIRLGRPELKLIN